MKLDFWFLLIIALIGIASILTAWMLSEHFRIEKERMEREASEKINRYDETMIGDYHTTKTAVVRKVLAQATVRVLANDSGGNMTCKYKAGRLDCWQS